MARLLRGALSGWKMHKHECPFLEIRIVGSKDENPRRRGVEVKPESSKVAKNVKQNKAYEMREKS